MHRGPQFTTPQVFFLNEKVNMSSKQAFLVCQGLAPPPYKFNSKAYIGKLYLIMIFEALLFVEWVIGVSQVSGEKGGKKLKLF